MAMTKSERAAAKQMRDEMKARLARLGEGIAAEIAAVNGAIRAGKQIVIPVRPGSLMSGKTVASVRDGHDGIWVTMSGYGGTYALGNDGRWAEIVDLAGVARDPRAEPSVGRR